MGIAYGYDFHQPPHAGIWGAAEYQDIKAAGEWLQKQDFVDAKRVGIYGGSYGGYLTAIALARDSKIFAAGVDIHGVHDWVTNSSLLNTFSGRDDKTPHYYQAVKKPPLFSPPSSFPTPSSPPFSLPPDYSR